MTEQTTEPTAFGRVIIDLTLERGLWAPEDLNLEPHYAQAVVDHFNGIRTDHEGLCLAVAKGIGLDPDSAEDAPECMKLALVYTFGDPRQLGV